MHTPSLSRARRAIPYALLTAGAVLLGACGGGDDDPPTGTTPSIGVTMSTATLAVVQGQSGTATATVARRGGFAGAVELAVTGAPAGVTAAFAPASIPGTVGTSTLTVTTTNAVAAGSYPLVVRATGAGVTPQTANVTLTVNTAQTPTVALASSAASLAVTQGTAAAPVTITLTRGGGFAGAVDLSVSGQPAGVTATLAPTSLAGGVTSSALTVSAGTAAAAGASTLTVTARAQGVADATVSIPLTVNAAAQPGTAVRFSFCAPDVPAWVAVQNGTAGAWTRVTAGANNTYDFNIADRGGVAYVESGAADADMTVVYGSVAELQAAGAAQCTLLRRGTKSVAGSVAGVGAEQFAQVALGTASAIVTPALATTFALDSVEDGPLTLLATRGSVDAEDAPVEGFSVDKLILRRNQNLANGATIPVLDFEATEAFVPARAPLLVNGLGNGETADVGSGFFTGLLGGGLFAFTSGPASQAYYSIPFDRLNAGEVQYLTIMAGPEDGSSLRGVFQYFRTPADRTVTLGPVLGTPAVSTTVTPYLRPRVQLALQAQYNGAVTADFEQGTRTATVTMTAAYLGGTAPATWDVAVPDFSGVTGFDTAWGLRPATSTTYSVSAYGGNFGSIIGNAPAENDTFLYASRDGEIGAAGVQSRMSRQIASARAQTPAARLMRRAARAAHASPYAR